LPAVATMGLNKALNKAPSAVSWSGYVAAGRPASFVSVPDSLSDLRLVGQRGE
jgi:hypothetical protein